MADELLLDTSALVSLLDRTQNHHEACVEWFDGWRGVVVSTEAVLTEATHLLSRVPGGREACIDFFLEGGATLVPSDVSSLRRCREFRRSQCSDTQSSARGRPIATKATDTSQYGSLWDG